MEPVQFKVFTNFSVHKDAKTGNVEYEGVASSTSLDRDEERMTLPALVKFAKDLNRSTSNGIFFNHDHKALKVGSIVKAWVDGNELKIKFVKTKAQGPIGNGGPLIADIHTQMDEGIYNCMSIGGRVLKREQVFDEKLGKSVGEIQDVEGLEVSIVGIGANPDASISSAIAKAFKPAGEAPRGNTLMAQEPTPAPVAVAKEAPVEVVKEAPVEVKPVAAELSKDNGPATPTASPALPSNDVLGALSAKVNALEGRLAELEGRIPKSNAPILTHTRSVEESKVEVKAVKAEDDVLVKELQRFNERMAAFEKSLQNPTLRSKGLVDEQAMPKEETNPFKAFIRQSAL